MTIALQVLWKIKGKPTLRLVSGERAASLRRQDSQSEIIIKRQVKKAPSTWAHSGDGPCSCSGFLVGQGLGGSRDERPSPIHGTHSPGGKTNKDTSNGSIMRNCCGRRLRSGRVYSAWRGWRGAGQQQPTHGAQQTAGGTSGLAAGTPGMRSEGRMSQSTKEDSREWEGQVETHALGQEQGTVRIHTGGSSKGKDTREERAVTLPHHSAPDLTHAPALPRVYFLIAWSWAWPRPRDLLWPMRR